jgi:environmental stress-induced protein Ves
MRKLDPATYRTMPWKNGGGTTTEVLVLPPGADLASFEARISMARVESDGAFSTFEGVDRTLLVMAGAGMILRGKDGATRTLGPASPPFAFAGDEALHATLIDGPVRDLNVMSRRSTLRHRVERLAVDGEPRLVCSGELSVVVVLEGEIVARDETREVAAAQGDVLSLAHGEWLRVARGRASRVPDVLVVDFFRP